MSAYLIFQRINTTNAAELVNYSSMVKDSFIHHEMDLLVAYGQQETLEGPETEGTVILKFTDKDAAQAWYYSEAYQQAARHRFAGANYSATLVNGLDSE